jgi:hypothetical protein
VLRIQDKDGRTKFILRDEDEEPISIDEFVLIESKRSKKEEEEEDGSGKE